MNNVEQLLNQVNALKNKYKLVNQLNATEFNVFHILKVHADERYTHSAFIAELLNPKGKHGQGTLFLDIFLRCLNIGLFNELDETKINVKTEFYTGDKTKRGFIDVVVQSERDFLAIENKINAPDQVHQLSNYEDFIITTKKNYKIIYLKPFGEDASEVSAKDLKKDYIRLSYKKDIKYWLEECLKEVGRKPIIRETIFQYIQIIKYICGVPLNHEEEMELKEILTKDFNNLEAASHIHAGYWEAKYNVKFKFWSEVRKKLEVHFRQNEKWEVSVRKNYFEKDDKYPGINVYLKRTNHRILRFKIEKLQDRFYFGILTHDDWSNLPLTIKDNYLSECKFEQSNNSIWIYKDTTNTEDFSQLETLEKVFNKREELKEEIVKRFIDFFEAHCSAIENILANIEYLN